jgi:hypothetical protein
MFTFRASLGRQKQLAATVAKHGTPTTGKQPFVTPAFLAPNKSPTKSRTFSKPSRWAHLSPSKPGRLSPLSPSVRVPRIPPAPPALGPSPTPCRPSAAVDHHAGNPAHAAVPPASPPRHHRHPENHANTRKTGNPHKILFPLPSIFLGFLLIF